VFLQTLFANLMVCAVVVVFFIFIALAVAEQLVCTDVKFLFSLKLIRDDIEVGFVPPVCNEIGR